MKNYFFLFGLLCAYVSKTQIRIDTSYFYLDTLSLTYYPKTNVTLDELTTRELGIFKTHANYLFQKKYEFVMDTFKYIAYDQYINGIRLEGNSYHITATPSDKIVKISGDVALPLITVPTVITPEEAISDLVANLPFYKFKWQDIDWEHFIKEDKEDSSASYYPVTQLRTMKTDPKSFDVMDNYTFIYPILISALNTRDDSLYFDSLYYVNAVTGDIIVRMEDGQTSFLNNKTSSRCALAVTPLKDEDPSTHLLPSPPGCSGSCEQGSTTIHYYGSQVVNSSKFLYSGFCKYRLKHTCNGPSIHVIKAGLFDEFRSSQANWPNPNLYEQVGITAMWCATRIQQTFKNNFNWSSFDTNGSELVVQVLDTETEWGRTSVMMHIGKFKNTASHQTVLDVMGHEYFHGILNNSSGLGNAQFPQSVSTAQLQSVRISATKFSIVEGFCDVMGQFVEHYVHGLYNTPSGCAIDDFVHGGNRPGGFNSGETRSLYDPSSTVNPSVIAGTDWDDVSSSDVAADIKAKIYKNSTIIGRWYYLLAVGGSGNTGSPVNYDYCVQGLGQERAAQIAFVTAAHYGNMINQYSSPFTGIFWATINAVRDINGGMWFTPDEAQVVDAWRGVGYVDNGAGSYQSPGISLTNHMASGTENYYYNAGLNVQNFTAGNTSNVTMTSGNSVGFGPILAVESGAFFNVYINSACTGGARAVNDNSAGTTEISDSMQSVSKMNEKASNFSIVPNPSTDGKFEVINVSEVANLKIKVLNNTGSVLREIINSTSIDITDLTRGVYIIEITYEDKKIIKKLIYL
jgi:Zn-dependent metalloprotease